MRIEDAHIGMHVNLVSFGTDLDNHFRLPWPGVITRISENSQMILINFDEPWGVHGNDPGILEVLAFCDELEPRNDIHSTHRNWSPQ